MWKDGKYEILLVATVAVWGLNFPVIKAALRVMHPHVFNVFRFSVSIVVLGSLYVAQERRVGRRLFEPYRRRALPVVSLGLLGFVVYQLCFIIGVNNTLAGTAALIMASAPVWTAVAGRLLEIESLPPAAWAGLMITLAGTVEIVLTGNNELSFESAALFGNVMMLAAAVCWGTYTALSRPMLQHVTPSGLAFLGLLPSLPILFLVAWPYGASFEWSVLTPWIWAAIIFSGALSTGLAFVTWSLAVKNLGSSHTAAFNNLVPVVALLMAAYLLDEPIMRGQVVGGALVLAGLYVMRRARRRQLQSTPMAS